MSLSFLVGNKETPGAPVRRYPGAPTDIQVCAREAYKSKTHAQWWLNKQIFNIYTWSAFFGGTHLGYYSFLITHKLSSAQSVFLFISHLQVLNSSIVHIKTFEQLFHVTLNTTKTSNVTDLQKCINLLFLRSKSLESPWKPPSTSVSRLAIKIPWVCRRGFSACKTSSGH